MDIIFKIIIPVRNNEECIKKCLDSLIHQTYQNWTAVVIDDVSEDGTLKVVKKIRDSFKKIKIVSRKNRQGALVNKVYAAKISHPKDEDVVVEIDGDDWLANDAVLETLRKAYTDSNTWLTYGSWIKYPSNARDTLGVQIPKDYAYNRGHWIFSPPRTSKFFLWKNLQEKSLIQPSTKRYYMRACDQAYFRPLAQMAGSQHIQWIRKILYVYNTRPGRIQFVSGTDPIDASHRELMHSIRKTWNYREMTKVELLKNNHLDDFKMLV